MAQRELARSRATAMGANAKHCRHPVCWPHICGACFRGPTGGEYHAAANSFQSVPPQRCVAAECYGIASTACLISRLAADGCFAGSAAPKQQSGWVFERGCRPVAEPCAPCQHGVWRMELPDVHVVESCWQ